MWCTWRFHNLPSSLDVCRWELLRRVPVVGCKVTACGWLAGGDASNIDGVTGCPGKHGVNLHVCIRNSDWPCLFSVFLDSCGSAASAAILKSMQPTVSTHFMSKVPQHSTQMIHASGKVVPEVADASDGLRRRNAGNQQMGSLEARQGASEACQDNTAEVRAALGGWAPMLRTRARIRNDPYYCT